MDEEKNKMSRGIANGLVGAIVVMLIIISMIFLNLTTANDQTDQNNHQAFITFDNQCNTTVNITVYIMSSNDWDKVFFDVDDGEQRAVTLTWNGDLQEVLVTYDIFDEFKVFQYHLEPDENRIVCLV